MLDRLPVRAAYAIGAAILIPGLAAVAFAVIILIGATQ